MVRRRLDLLLVERGLVESREKAKARVLAGDVRVAGQVVRIPSATVPTEAEIVVQRPPPFVGRGGIKLAGALQVFQPPVAGRVAADIGASTGGFTDCLLQHGARRVYAIDVGRGQLDYRLQTDPRVVVLDRQNARYLDRLPEPIDLATIDVSFISVRLILPALRDLLAPWGELIVLIKPQFEAGRDRVGKKGVIQDSAVHRSVLAEFAEWALAHGWTIRGITPSPLRGAEGNREFFVHLAPTGPSIDPAPAIEAALAAAHPRVID